MKIGNDIRTFSAHNLDGWCDRLGKKDRQIRQMISTYGYPRVPERPAGFEGLVRLILEQQVSLASARSVLEKLGHRIERISPENILQLDEPDFRACGFSAQKIRYVKALATAVRDKHIDPERFEKQPDDRVKKELLRITGIGSWTCECYLLLHLKRLDIFPIGDLALRKAMVENRLVDKDASASEIERKALTFSPCRSVLALLLWHAYKKSRGIRIE